MKISVWKKIEYLLILGPGGNKYTNMHESIPVYDQHLPKKIMHLFYRFNWIRVFL